MADITNIISTGESIDVSINGSSGINAVLTGTSGINVTLIEGGISYIGTAGYAMSAGSAGYATSAGYAANVGTAAYATSSGQSGTSSYSVLSGTANFATSSGNSGTAFYSTSAGSSGYASSAAIAGTAPYAGTASFATSSGNAGTSDISGTSSYATSSGESGTASYSALAGTAVYATSAGESGTASYSVLAGTSSYASSSGFSGTADYSALAGTASFATSSGNAGTADISGTSSYATSSGKSGTSAIAGTASYATSSGNSGTSFYATSAGQAGTALKATSAGNAGSASYASTAAIAGTAPYAGTSSYATSAGNSGTAYYATSAGKAGTSVKATSAGYAGTSQVSLTAASETVSGVVELATSTEAIAGTDALRVVTPAGNAASEAVIKNPLQMAQGVKMTYVASGSTGIMVADNDNINFGTGNFSLVWRGSLPDWTPAANNAVLFFKQAIPAGFTLGILASTGKTFMQVRDATNGTLTYSSTISLNIADGAVAEITAVVTRKVGLVDGSIAFYCNGILIETLPITTDTYSVSNTIISCYVSGSLTVRTASVTQFAATFNRALSAAEVLDLYRNGINFADKWGSQTPVYTGDFSAGDDGWTASGGAVAGNIDGIGGEDDFLRFTIDANNSPHYATKNKLLQVGKNYRVDVTYYIPSTNSALTNLAFYILDNQQIGAGTVLDAVTTISTTFTVTAPSPTAIRVYGRGSSVIFQDAGGDDVFYIKNVVITEVGATLALEQEGIQPAPGQWLDSSSNKLHAWQPTTGSTITRKKTEFEIRGINTWTASHAAQSIAMTSDASRAMLPANCYIESIVGVVAGADIEDIIIGNGSDTDYWVELTTGLAAGTVSFMLANRISDGTNYELVVDPDADCTMTITWTIKGYVLD